MVGFITHDNPLVLASESPRRRMLLEQIKIPFLQTASNSEERHETGDPLKDVCLIARAKASAVAFLKPHRWILGADTAVVMGKETFGKPEGDEEARHMLRRLSGKSHNVITGISIISLDRLKEHTESVVTEVRFRVLSQKEIDGYLATGEHRGKAGAYAIQGIGAFMVEGIRGSYTNVVGLPLCRLVKALLGLGAISEFPITPTRPD